MHRDDFFMRYIEQLTRGIARILGLKRDNKLQEAGQQADDLLKELLGMDTNTVDALSYKDLAKLVSYGETWNPDKCFILARLLKEKADLSEAEGRMVQSYNDNLKALNLFLGVALLEHKDFAAKYRYSLDDLIHQMETFALPEETLYSLFLYNEQQGQFAKAEDLLYELKERKEDRTLHIHWPDEAESFYKRLLKKSTEELEAGNLPRPEIEDALRKLR